jgi:TonB-linked SusC/RagA family outer membrane protein
MLVGVLAFAQNRVVTGRVTTTDGTGVPFASVLLNGSKSTGTFADENGNFSIKAKTGDILTISGTGVKLKKVTVDASSNITASLEKSNVELSTVVVTALNQKRAKSTLGYSTATVKATELTQGRASNLVQGLTAKVSGLSIQQTNSGVKQETRLTSRGIRSLTGNNQMMVVLDGIPVPSNFLSSINPNDILTSDILKSATSAAIYGADGVNGALVITTKRGNKNKPVITFSQSTQFESISFMPKFQDKWGAGYNQNSNTGQGTYSPEEQQSWGDEFDGSMRDFGEADPNGNIRKQQYSYIPGERRRFYDVGTTNQTDLSYSSGDFYLSGQNVSIKGTMPGDVLSRRGITFKAEKEYNKFKATGSLRYTQTKSNTTTQNVQVYYGVTSAPGNVPLTQFSDWRNDFYSSPDGYYTPYLTNFSNTPYFAKDNHRRDDKTNDIFGNLDFTYKVNNNLNFVYRIGVTNTNVEATVSNGAYTPKYRTAVKVLAAGLTEFNQNNTRLTSEFFGNYSKSFGKLDFSSTIGYSYRESKTRFLSLGSTNLGQSTFLTINNRIGEPNVNTNNSLAKVERLFGNVNFNFNKWFNLMATASYDKDSRLVPANKIFNTKDISFFYPSVNTAILLHEIFPAIKDNKILNFAKISGSIAKTGNVNINPYQNETVFNRATFFPFNSTSGFQIGNTVYPAQGLKPEFVLSKEVGIELGFLKNKVMFEASYYSQKNTDQILNLQLSRSTGASQAVLNAAEFVNKGLELDLKLTPLVTLGDFSVDVKFNYANQKNKIISLIDGVDELGLGNFNFAVKNSPAFVFKLTDYVRDPATGKVIVDSKTGMPSANPIQTQFGKTLPEHIMGTAINVNWRNISLAIVGQYSTGNSIVSDQLGAFMDDNGISARSGDFGRRAFVFPNSVIETSPGKYVDNTNVYTRQYGRLFYNSDLNTGVETNYLSSGAFFKLREVSLAYNFPSSLFVGKAIKGATASFSGRNLLMWLPKSNQWTDPEFSFGGAGGGINTGNNGGSTAGTNALGRNTADNAPPTRIMGLTLSLQF